MVSGASLLLAPGAGAGRDQPQLVAIDAAVSAAGVTVCRMDFPYRLAGRRAPDRPGVLLAAVVAAVEGLAGGRPLAVGGRSMGGRLCSMAVADGSVEADAVVLVSYPLHPPGRPDRLRDGHFGDIRVPCLFVSGTRDGFGTPAELEAATAAVGGPVTHHWIEGRDHSLRRSDDEVATVVAGWLRANGF
jgi:predicted alpha/beta-hydrolase family hydrolase